MVTRASLSLRSAPGDGVAGLPVSLRVDSGSRLRVRPVEPPGPDMFVGPRSRRGVADELVVLVPTRRGVHACLTLDIASAAPFALQWWTRRVQLPLPSPLHVSPRCGGAEPAPRRPADDDAGDGIEQPRVEAGLPRGARPYVPGDARRLVHWRSTAHAGRLMVREVEQPAAAPVTMTVELPTDPDAAERVAEGALGSVVRLLARGRPGSPRDEGGCGARRRARVRPAQRGAAAWPAPSPASYRVAADRERH